MVFFSKSSRGRKNVFVWLLCSVMIVIRLVIEYFINKWPSLIYYRAAFVLLILDFFFLPETEFISQTIIRFSWPSLKIDVVSKRKVAPIFFQEKKRKKFPSSNQNMDHPFMTDIIKLYRVPNSRST